MPIFFILALISFSALACPKLAGLYVNCRSMDEQGTTAVEVKIQQQMINRAHQFTFQTKENEDESPRVDTYIADGITRASEEVDQDTGVVMRTEATASCSQDIFHLILKTTLDSEEFANLKVQIFKKNGQVHQIYSGLSMGEAVKDTVICYPKN